MKLFLLVFRIALWLIYLIYVLKNGFTFNKSNSLIKLELSTKNEGFSKWKNEIAVADSNKIKKNDVALAERLQVFLLLQKRQWNFTCNYNQNKYCK